MKMPILFSKLNQTFFPKLASIISYSNWKCTYIARISCRIEQTIYFCTSCCCCKRTFRPSANFRDRLISCLCFCQKCYHYTFTGSTAFVSVSVARPGRYKRVMRARTQSSHDKFLCGVCDWARFVRLVSRTLYTYLYGVELFFVRFNYGLTSGPLSEKNWNLFSHSLIVSDVSSAVTARHRLLLDFKNSFGHFRLARVANMDFRRPVT